MFALLLALLAAHPIAVRASPWPAAESDLPAHPALREGTLANGLRYLVLPNGEPHNRISLRLLVGVGSLHEADDELGLAHFLEHMAFRGTRTHPAGSLTATLQRLGVSVGPENTAFTSYDNTLYHLELPDAQEVTLQEGLQVLREYAEEITFDRKAIERERGVVLSEQQTRNTPENRASLVNLAFLWPKSRQIQRPVGGSAARIRTFTRAQFRAFYDAWYRPERMAVVIVGNIDPAVATAQVERTFGRLKPRAPARPEPLHLSPPQASKPDIEIFADPGIVGFTITFQRPLPEPREKDTHARRVEKLHLALACAMLQRRLEKIAHEPQASFVAPSSYISGSLPGWNVISLGVHGKIDDWKKVAADLEREHRRAFQFGFTTAELEEARTNFAAAYEQAVRTSATWPSEWLAGQLVGGLIAGNRLTNPADVQRDIAEALATATPADCRQAFRTAWTAGAPHVFIVTHPVFQITREQIAAALNESRSTEVARREETAPVEFAYRDFGPPGKLVRDEHVADLDVRLTQFANNVRLNFKATPFEADTVAIYVRVGAGKLLQPPTLPGLDLLADYVVTGGGLGKHTAQELTSLLAGRAFSVTFRAGMDACIFAGRCAPRDLRLCLQVITAFLSDAAYRPETMRETHGAFNSMYASLANAPSGPISLHAMRELASGDRRFGVPESDELFRRNIDELKDWIEPQFKVGAIELSVVGDIAWEDALTAVAHTLGALPERELERSPRADLTVKPPAGPVAGKAFAANPKLRLCALALYWPVPPIQDIREERRCRLLASVLNERCRIRVREELGAAYSTAASFDEIPGFPHLTFFSAYAEVDPRRAQQALEIIRREARDLARKGVKADEFMRAKQPFLRGRTDDLRTNAYWGVTVLGDAQQNPSRLDHARSRTADTDAITRAELSQLARLHLDPEKSIRFGTVLPVFVFPQKTNPPAGPPPIVPMPSDPRRQ